jgi:hypothetical protein
VLISIIIVDIMVTGPDIAVIKLAVPEDYGEEIYHL